MSQWHRRWADLAGRARDRLSGTGLEGLMEALTMVIRPLGPLAAAMLWIAEPMFGEPVGALANLLDDDEPEE